MYVCMYVCICTVGTKVKFTYCICSMTVLRQQYA